MTIRVLICDDSAVMRGLLTQIIDSDPRLEVVGVAADPLVARDLIKSLDPDVLTLDVEMPRMGGIEFLERLMRLRPMPVVMISSFTERGSEATLRALELGAVDFLAKPGSSLQIGEQAREIREKIIAAFDARKRFALHMPARPKASIGGVTGSALPERVLREKVVLIGASTGGTEAIKEVLSRLPEACPPLMLVQHMPEMFTASFARRMDSLCALRVKEAEHGERLMAGTAYIAPGHSHLKLGRLGTVMQCELSATPPVNRHRPSVDVLFASAAPLLGANALGVLLTGMGKDGAQGLLSLRKRGAWTLAQDQESSVVWGMPREAAAIGAACEIASLGDISARIMVRLARTTSLSG